MLVEQVHHAATRVSGHRDSDEARSERARRLTFEEISRVRGGRAVVAMDPNATAKPLGVLACVRNIVLVREKDVGDAAGVLEPLHELCGASRRLDKEVA